MVTGLPPVLKRPKYSLKNYYILFSVFLFFSMQKLYCTCFRDLEVSELNNYRLETFVSSFLKT